MSWLDRFVRPKVRALVRKPDIPENLWDKCPQCEQMIFRRELAASLFVCPQCGHHMRIGPKQRFDALFDEGQYQLIELPKTAADPLKFKDRKRYTDRLREAQEATGQEDAILVAHGTMGGEPVVVAALDCSFLGDSMGVAVGAAMLTAARLAVLQEASLIAIPASGGARMQEGVLSLMQMARTTIGIDEVKEAGLPYLVVLTHPTTGGVTASFASLGDLLIAEPDAIIGFAGQRVIEETIRETLPEGFQRSEYLLEHGMVDMVVHRHELRDMIVRLLKLLRAPRSPAPVIDLPQEALEIPPPATSGSTEQKAEQKAEQRNDSDSS
jgi:acetyl-CoA carboxylase carboxyl transferase subunit beta